MTSEGLKYLNSHIDEIVDYVMERFEMATDTITANKFCNDMSVGDKVKITNKAQGLVAYYLKNQFEVIMKEVNFNLPEYIEDKDLWLSNYWEV